ncbi:Efflux RND transporter periplasmic adaptor subunit [Sulfidibacter corallicola]|uniref:Efflux RND transporter periplasmic adaptor subunit n=1 Tax=Sulfidibacter corallicola TaxID=2818388 RepID=A0A8A4TR74_SULCO|nr:efflux RND transporter periplasmic adaptor subunit [Sulfidibacter corallicola]QTD51592.1 efflux RND transporter periplasmic adaptor subunit [Sulfidibacter corallicola]
MKKLSIVLILTALVAGGVFFAVQQPLSADDDSSSKKSEEKDDEKKKKEPVYLVELHTVGSREMTTYVSGTATLQADRQVDIFPKAAGQIKTLKVEEGQKVSKGDLLIALDGDDARLQLEQARVNLKRAQAEYKRIKTSYDKSLVSTEEFDAKKFEMERMKAEFDIANYKVEMTQVVAPFNGTVVNRFAELGQTVQPSEKLFTIAALDPLKAEVFLPERQTYDLETGQTVTFSRTDAFKDAFDGSVTRISPVVDRETGTVKVTISVTEAPRYVRPGTYAHLRIVTHVEQSDTVLPKKALVYDSRQNTYVFLAERDEKDVDKLRVKKKEVKTGIEESVYVQITEGLQAGDRIVLTGKDSLKDGALIKDPNVEVSAKK